jgi:hypothetical protein
MNQTEGTGSVSLRDFFCYHGRPVKNLNDFWGWKADQITEDLKQMLDELKGFIKELRQNKNANQTEMAEKLSGPLKSYCRPKRHQSGQCNAWGSGKTRKTASG